MTTINKILSLDQVPIRIDDDRLSWDCLSICEVVSGRPGQAELQFTSQNGDYCIALF